jgi:AAA ATPase domain
MMTSLLVEWAGACTGAAVRAALDGAAGAAAAPPAPPRLVVDTPGRRVLVAGYRMAIDAARAALRVVDAAAEDAGLRVALAAGPPPDGEPDPAGLALLERAQPGRVVVAAPAAVLLGPLLPLDLELVDVRGPVPAGACHAERAFVLRPADGGEPAGAGPGARGASNLAWAWRAAAGPLVGRRVPTMALDAAWHDALSGAPRTAVVSGESGIGKTALAAEFALGAHAQGALVLYGRWDRGRIAPYQAVREALGSYAAGCPADRLADDLGEHRATIGRLLPDVAARLGDPAPPRALGDPQTERLRLYDAVEAWVGRLAAERPVLLVLDDLHWAERSSRLLIDHLHRRDGAQPWMLLVTLRDPPEEILATTRHIGLRGLDAGAVAELAGQVLEDRPAADDRTIEWLTAETAGNPLFVHHTLCSLPATATVAALDAARDQVPDQLRDVIRWRVGQLPEPARRRLTDIAAAGPGVDLPLLAAALRQAPVHVRDSLAPAVAQDLVRLEGADDRVVFTHEVVRRALDGDSHPRRTAWLHRRLAEVLEDRLSRGGEVAPAEVADHRLRGADAETAADAVRWARRAADEAHRATGFDEAAQLLQRAVEVHDTWGAPDDALSCELLLELGRALDHAGRGRDRDARLLRAAALARDLDRTDLFARAALGYGGRLPIAPPPDRTMRSLLSEALDRLLEEDSPERALVLARLAHATHLDAPLEVRRGLADRAVAMARRLRSPELVAATTATGCLALERPDGIEERLAAADEVERIGRELDDPDLLLQGIRLRIPALLGLGRPRDARELAAAYEALAREIRHHDHLRVAGLWQVMCAGLAGDLASVEASLVEITRRMAEAGHPQARYVRFAYSFVPRWLHGRLERSRGPVDAVRATQPEWHTGWALSVWIDAATGHEARALARLDERRPADVLRRTGRNFMWWPTMAALAVGASCGHRDWAEAVHGTLAAYSGRVGVTGHALLVGAVDHHLGTLALALGRRGEAVDRLEAALLAHRALDAPPFVAFTARWLARALALRDLPGDRSRAAALEAEADELGRRLGLASLPAVRDPAAAAT